MVFVSIKDDLYLIEPEKVARIIKEKFSDKEIKDEATEISLNSVIHETLNSLGVPKENRGYCLFQLGPHLT